MNGTEIRSVLAKNIKSYRENRLWSQADMAEYSNISVPFLSEIERGNKWPFPETLGKIANALNVQVQDLFRDGASSSSEERDFSKKIVEEMLVAQKMAAERVVKQYLGETVNS